MIQKLRLPSPPATSGCEFGFVDVCTSSTVCAGAVEFMYDRVAPAVTGLSPSSGPPSGGTVVTISGSNFTGGAGGATLDVTFGGVAATDIVFINDSTIQATSPAGTPCRVVDVQVTTQCTGSSPIVPADQFTYAVLPMVTNVSPNIDTPLSQVIVSGANYVAFSDIVNFGVTPSPFVIPTFVTLQATVPTIPGATNCQVFEVTVTTCAGTSLLNPPFDLFTYRTEGVPTVTGVDPKSRPATTPVTITGVGFTGATAVSFGSTPAPGFTVFNDSTITVDVPTIAGATNCERFDVTVTTSFGTSPLNPPDDQFITKQKLRQSCWILIQIPQLGVVSDDNGHEFHRSTVFNSLGEITLSDFIDTIDDQ